MLFILDGGRMDSLTVLLEGGCLAVPLDSLRLEIAEYSEAVPYSGCSIGRWPVQLVGKRMDGARSRHAIFLGPPLGAITVPGVFMLLHTVRFVPVRVTFGCLFALPVWSSSIQERLVALSSVLCVESAHPRLILKGLGIIEGHARSAVHHEFCLLLGDWGTLFDVLSQLYCRLQRIICDRLTRPIRKASDESTRRPVSNNSSAYSDYGAVATTGLSTPRDLAPRSVAATCRTSVG